MRDEFRTVGIGIASACSRLQVDELEFIETFEVQLGLIISDYLRKRRVLVAAVMLLGTKLSMEEVKDFVGYVDNKVFEYDSAKVMELDAASCRYELKMHTEPFCGQSAPGSEG